MLTNPMETADWRGRKAREFNRPTGLLAGEVAEYRRPVRWAFWIITAVQAVVVFGVVAVVWSLLG